MSAAAVIPSLLPLFMLVAMRRAEARLYRQLADAKASTPESAVPLSPGRSIDRRRLQGLIRGGAIRLNASGHHFLDADGWVRYQRDRRRRGLLAVSVLVALLGVAFAIAFLVR